MLDSSLEVESSGVEEDFRDFGGKVSICIYMIQVIGWHVGIYIFFLLPHTIYSHESRIESLETIHR